jgi:hypothetical protein
VDFSVTIEGLDALAHNTQAIQQSVQEELDKGLYASAQHVATEYKQSILGGPKSGRIYKRRSVTHQASAPGEAPASDTGRLVNAIHVALDGTLAAVMRVTTAYAMVLEFGSRFIAARPAAVPALEKSRQWIIDRLALAMKTGMSRK